MIHSKVIQLHNLRLTLATEAEKQELRDGTIDSFDFTKLSAINTCPRWGILRYTKHKAMSGGGRAMALEAGKAMHEAFSAVRLFQLGYTQGLREHYEHHGLRLFGVDRFTQMKAVADAGFRSADAVTAMRNFATEALETAGFIEDPFFDKRRTYANLETSLLYYLQRWDSERYPVWVRDLLDPTADIGIEIPFTVMVNMVQGQSVRRFMYTGRIDGIHHSRMLSADGSHTHSPLLIGENKTASRLNDAWRMAFDVNHQPTGYCIAGTLFADRLVDEALIHGISIPLPRMMSEGHAIERVLRPLHMWRSWGAWLEHTVKTHDQYVGDVRDAPMYTHSCNRYFRPCSFIPLCYADRDEQLDIINGMVVEQWSPLHEDSKDSD